MRNIIFLFFNGGGLHKNQWFTHPYKNDDKWFNRIDEHKSTDIIKKIKKYGDVYLYTPIFYCYHNEVLSGTTFNLNDLDLKNHCKNIYESIKHYKYIYIISHSRGWIIAKFFCLIIK